jgi:hypothetical protein
MFALALLLTVHLMPEAPEVAWKQPQLANRGDVVGMTFGAGNTIYYTSSADHGKSFSKPVKVAEKGFLSLGRHRGPRVDFQSGNVIITAVTGAKGRGADGDLWAWISKDDGKNWSEPVRINDVEGSAREGLHAMASGNGMVVAVWLDLRQKGTRLYSSISRDGGQSWAKNLLVYESPEGHICECCHPSVLIGTGGAIHVMFRNWLEGSRDMYMAVSRDNGKTYETKKLGRGTWKLNACPMDGGGLTLASDGTPYTIWRREQTVYTVKPDGLEVEMGPGRDGAIAAGLNNSLYAAWVSEGAVKLRTTLKPDVMTLAPKGDFPQLIMMGNGGVLAAWEQDGGIAVQAVTP